MSNQIDYSTEVEIVSSSSAFIEANTLEVSLQEIEQHHIVPSYTKDYEPLISVGDFINRTQDVLHHYLDGETILAPAIRVSHPIKGRVPEARFKPTSELQEHEKTVYYERTMFLFEMATLGKRVLIPEINLLKDLAQKVPGVLSELSYFQVHGLSTEGLSSDDLNNYNSPIFYNQWLDFADFYDSDLMPNVELFEDFSELKHYSSSFIPNQQIHSLRNRSLYDKRANFVDSFIQKL